MNSLGDLISVGDVPGDDAAGLGDPQQLSERLHNHYGDNQQLSERLHNYYGDNQQLSEQQQQYSKLSTTTTTQ